MFGLLYVNSQLVVSDDAVATANNLVSNELLFRAGIVSNLITQLLFIVIPLFLFRLFEEVDRIQALLMVILALVSVPIAMLNELMNVAALLTTSDPGQMQLFVDLNAQGVAIASIFWGLWLFPLGILIIRSGYFPKIVGWTVIIAGIGYTLDSFLKLLVPEFAALSVIFQVMTIGEIVFLLWLTIKGARLPRENQ
ncbi:MAG: DUF4386 domain-containing protein [Anaerolineales bacterium]|nr:DUF4386 domain-containing protein [Anaerolineales bacterium]MCB8953230.1 DUF4386 domain-containing protein [Ardenticatenales bacterium]